MPDELLAFELGDRFCTLATNGHARIFSINEDGMPRQILPESGHRADNAEVTGRGICRTCLHPIWYEGGTVDHVQKAEGWSDRIGHSGDSLVCFSARDYRHLPLMGREAAIYDHAIRLAIPSES